MIPASASGFTAEWISTILGRSVRPVRVARIGEGFGLGGTSFRIDLDSDEPIVAKLSDAGACERETTFYREIAPEIDVPVPGFVGADWDRDEDRGVLLMRFVEDGRQGDVLEGSSLEESCALARILARLHGPFLGREDARDLPVPETALGTGEIAPDRIPRFLERYGDQLTRAQREMACALPTSLPEAVAALRDEPRTLIHSDFHLDNVLFTEARGPVVLDWQSVGRGPAATDVARLLVECMSPAQQAARRPRLLEVYSEEIARFGAGPLDERILRHALVRLFAGVVGWLGAKTDGEEHPRVARIKENVLDGALSGLAR